MAGAGGAGAHRRAGRQRAAPHAAALRAAALCPRPRSAPAAHLEAVRDLLGGRALAVGPLLDAQPAHHLFEDCGGAKAQVPCRVYLCHVEAALQRGREGGGEGEGWSARCGQGGRPRWRPLAQATQRCRSKHQTCRTRAPHLSLQDLDGDLAAHVLAGAQHRGRLVPLGRPLERRAARHPRATPRRPGWQPPGASSPPSGSPSASDSRSPPSESEAAAMASSSSESSSARRRRLTAARRAGRRPGLSPPPPPGSRLCVSALPPLLLGPSPRLAASLQGGRA